MGDRSWITWVKDAVRTEVSKADPLPIGFQTDSANFDAFARLRVSNPTTIFDNKQIHNNGALYWDDVERTGSGTTSTWSKNTASTVLAVSATTAGKRQRQTFMRFNYQPGKSQLILLTGVLNKSGGGAGVTSCWGYGDDNNGLFIFNNEGSILFVKRTSHSGSPVDTMIAQADWNIDKMDGTGDSGITLDFSKSQILLIDFEWLGVGRVRMGFVVDGIPYYSHQFLHTNVLSNVYMSTPNLPISYWIENDGSGAASSIEHICATVISEGGITELGTDHSQSTENTFIQAATAGTRYAVFGIRLKAANLDSVVKIINIFIMNAQADDYHWELLMNPTLAGTPGVWQDDEDATIQYATGDVTADPSTTTVTNGHVIDAGFVKGGKDTGAMSKISLSQLRLGSKIDETRDEIWLAVMPIGSGSLNADIYGGIAWKEVS